MARVSFRLMKLLWSGQGKFRITIIIVCIYAKLGK